MHRPCSAYYVGSANKNYLQGKAIIYSRNATNLENLAKIGRVGLLSEIIGLEPIHTVTMT